jgi:hypothetical protein
MSSCQTKLILLGCLLVLSLSSCLSKDDEIKVNQERGNKIVQAINDYQREQGQFPKQLDLLVPNYLSEIPKTISGYDFEYGLDDLDGYYLGFDIQRGNGCGYAPRFQVWDCTGGIDH